MKKSDNLIFTLSKTSVIFLFIYYTAIIIVGGVIAIKIACSMEQVTHGQLLKNTFFASLSVSGMLCSIQYIKRLYKACLTERIDSDDNKYKRIGNIIYFLLRPLFSWAFVIVMVFSLLSGMFVVSGNLDYVLNEKFLYLCVIVSSFIGFSIGKLLDKFEILSDEKIDSIKIGG